MLISKAVNLIKSKTAIIVSMLTLFWVVNDFNERVKRNDYVAGNSAELADVINVAIPALDEEIVEQLQLISANYKKTDTNNVGVTLASKIMSEQQQSQQQGALSEVYAGDKKLVLKALLIQNVAQKESTDAALLSRKVALIEVTDLPSNKKDIEEFLNNQDVYGFKLKIETNHRVKLTKIDETHHQIITLNMYKRESETQSNE